MNARVEEIEQAVKGLSPNDLAKFRAWFLEFDNDEWDRQIEADAAAGKFDEMAARALAEYNAGQAKEI